MPVDEFRTVVGVDAQQAEGQARLDLRQGVPHRDLALAQQGVALRPAAVNIGQVQRVGEFPAGRVARMRHQINLGKPGHLHLPVIGLDRDLVFEQGARSGAAIETPPQPLLAGSQPAVDLTRTDAQPLPLQVGVEAKLFPDPGQPEGDQGFQTDRPGAAGRLPHRRQHRHHPRAIGRRTGRRVRAWTWPGGGPFNSRMAYFRLYRVLAQNSLKMACLTWREARR